MKKDLFSLQLLQDLISTISLPQNNSEYALNIECDSIEYELWASRLGDTDISSGLVVNAQPLLGSVFKSQT